MSGESPTGLPGWAILELMGHRRLVGYCQEVEMAGQVMIRIDVPAPDGKHATQIYGGSSVYCLTPCTREAAELKLAGQWQYEHEYRALPAPVDFDFASAADDEQVDDDDDENLREFIGDEQRAKHEGDALPYDEDEERPF